MLALKYKAVRHVLVFGGKLSLRVILLSKKMMFKKCFQQQQCNYTKHAASETTVIDNAHWED